ncbi:hypothetical protein, partial [Flavobacterium daejeonense]|uniref:hypothetical protein n=1 Tax=Flavobacterium daejeonense TaxID=350893 RepID=UPI00047E59A5
LKVNGIDKVPTFYVNDPESHFIDVYFPETQNASLKWKFKTLPNWIQVSSSSGHFFPDDSVLLEERISLSVDWSKWEKAGKPASDYLVIQGDGFEKKILVNVSDSYTNVPKNAIVEKNGLAVLYAESFVNNKPFENLKWEALKGFGHSKTAMQATPLNSLPVTDYEKTAVLEYEIFAETITNNAELNLVAIPTHPLDVDGKVRIAVQWNEEPIKILDFKTEGRSKTWKENVFTNKAINKMKVAIKNQGKQRLKIYRIDSGVVLDYMVLKTNKGALPYQLGKESKIR